MEYSDYYMKLPLDLAGSRTKNRFRIELLWGISKLIDAYKEYDDYTVVFDFKCDIELHYKNGLNFYQIKTKDDENYNIKSLIRQKKNSNSILGKLYALYTPEQNIKLAIVCNKYLKNNRTLERKESICLGNLEISVIEDIKERLKKELNLSEVILDNVFYILAGMDLINPDYALNGKLIESFQEIKNEEPNNPNALYMLVSETVQKKASYELEIDKYNDVLSLKGISRKEFDKMLESHRKKSITGIEQVKEYIKSLSPYERRIYNQALTNLLEVDYSYNINELKDDVFKYIEENINEIKNENDVLNILSIAFDDDFPIEYTKVMKNIFYLLIFYIYVEGGEI